MPRFKTHIAFCLVAAFVWTGASSQTPAQAFHQTLLRQILSLQFDSVENRIDKAGLDPETGPEILYLSNYLAFLDALIKGDRHGYETYLSGVSHRTHALRSGNGRHPESLALLSAIHLQSSFMNAFHGENFKAARNFYVAQRYLRQAESACPGDRFNQKLDGLVHLMAGAAPDEYHWLMSLFGIRGDMELGLKKLSEYHEGTSGTDRLESCLIMLYALQLTGQGTGIRTAGCGADTLTLHRYFLAYHALKSGQSREVIGMLQNWKQDAGEPRLAYLDLLLGEALLTGIDPSAGEQLLCFLETTRGEHLVKTAWHKLSWHYFLEGDTAAYRAARDSVMGKGNMFLDSDKQAFREAAENVFPNAGLLRSRLFFDGGYYRKSAESLQLIEPGDLATRKDSLEYTYRLARIADRLGDTVEAVSRYKEVIGDKKCPSWYFPSNAALHLGIIYEDLGDTANALETYQQCLKINRSAYRNSIGNKAKSGMRRLN